MKKLLGAHQFLNSVVCDRCGFKTIGLDQISRVVMRQHIEAKHTLPTAGETPAAEAAACLSCSRGGGGGGYPCDCPAACGARYCQHETTDTTKEN